MNKKIIKNVIIGFLMLAMIVGYYLYLSGKNTKDAESEVIETTLTQDVLARDLEKSYPPTPKEVMKYYNEIQECYYGEGNDEATIKALMQKSRELFSEELIEENPEDTQLKDLMKEIKSFEEKDMDIFAWSTDEADDVVYNSFDGADWATIHSYYTIRTSGIHTKTTEIFLMKKDAEGKWKIYGWDLAQSENTGE